MVHPRITILIEQVILSLWVLEDFHNPRMYQLNVTHVPGRTYNKQGSKLGGFKNKSGNKYKNESEQDGLEAIFVQL